MEVKEELEFKSAVKDTSSVSDLFSDLDMSTVEGKRTAATRLVDVSKLKGINVPAADQEARVRYGSIIVNNAGKTPDELLVIAEQMFGTVAGTVAKSEGSKAGTLCPENAGLVHVLSTI